MYRLQEPVERGAMADDDVKALLKQIVDFLPTLATKADLTALDDKLSARIDGVRADLTALDDKLSARIDGVRADLTALDDKLSARIDGVKAELARLETRTDTGFQVVNARLDEQGRVITALIPTHLAAVPAARQVG
jgi:hypothetical protein